MNIRSLVILGAAGLSAAACGATSSPSESNTAGASSASSSSAAAAPASSSSAAATPAGSPQAAMVSTATAGVAGKPETVLVDAQGRSLYYFTPDKAGKPTCTGGCAANWPAAMLPSGATKPTGASTLTGTLDAVAGATGGSQITYNGWPLYNFAGDQAPGDVHGQGIAGKWFVATPGLAAAGASGSTSASSSSYSGY